MDIPPGGWQVNEPSEKTGFFRQTRPFIWFLLANVVCGLFVFRGGVWGTDLLAPLDILPAVCSKYRFIDPNTSEVPANHFIVDQVTYDLPVQMSIYRAYRNGEIPWWDPYNWAGRPLLAEAHINGTEPIRVLNYLTLPFEWAYNWTRILNFVFSGLAMLLLLRHWRFPDFSCVLLALTYEFAVGFVFYFGHPWIQSSFNYYPLIWLAWDAWFRKRNWWSWPLATLAVAGVFNAGNLQSHAYILFFAGAILLGYGGLSWSRWKIMFPLVAVSGILGAALVAPLLLNELEFYRLNLRRAGITETGSPLGGLFTLFTIYPWAPGTFRTVDAAKIFNRSNVGFYLFIGSAGVLLALLGILKRINQGELSPVKRTGIWLVAAYVLIVCSPLVSMLYSRCAGLGVLGLVVLAALGVDVLMKSEKALRGWGRFAIILTIVAVVGTHIGALVIYPRYLPKIREMAMAKSQRSMTGLRNANALRDFQLSNFANEVTFRNPEPLVASLSMLGFAGICLWPVWRQRRGVLPALLALNLVPLLLFAHRYIPAHPIGLWRTLMGPETEQRRVAGVLSPGKLRLAEFPLSHFDCLYPNALSHLFQVRMTHGYSSLWPRSFAAMSPEILQRWMPQVADYLYVSPVEGEAAGYLKKNLTPGLARFQWVGPEYRRVVVEKETMNEIQLQIGDGTEAGMVRTDTHFPGWSARIGDQQIEIRKIGPSFSTITIPAQPQTLVLRYEPTYLRLGLKVSVAALAMLVAITVAIGWFCRVRKVPA